MKIGGFRACSKTDYPDREAAVIFTQGCNWRCPYCRSACLVVPEAFGEPIPEGRVLSYLQALAPRRKAVVVSGGEPTIHADLPNFLSDLRELGLTIKLDTNGSNPEMLRRIFQNNLVDYVAMDVKSPYTSYSQAAGKRVEADAIRTSIWVVKHSGIPYEFRTTVIPGLHTVNELKEIGNLVRGAEKLVLQGYDSAHAMRPDFRNRVAFTRKTLEGMGKFFSRKVRKFEVRGTDQAASVPDPQSLVEEEIAV